MLRALASLILFISSGAFAHSATNGEDCVFTPRVAVDSFLEALPENVVGWVNCGASHPEASLFIVIKLDDVDERNLQRLVLEHARLVDPQSAAARIRWSSRQPLEKRQLLVDTRDLTQDSAMTHYAFVGRAFDKTTYVFVHSIDARSSQLIRNTLDRLHTSITQASFLTRLRQVEEVQTIERLPEPTVSIRAPASVRRSPRG